MKNPFTHTPGRVGDANINTGFENIVFENFSYDQPSECVYKIIGIRGSGKTVIFGNILRHYKSDEMVKEGWLAYDLTSTGDPVSTLTSYLLMVPEVKKVLLKEKIDISVSIPVVGINAGVESKSELDEEVRLEQLIDILVKAKKKILIGIDDIAKTGEMTRFCSIYAKLIRNTTSDGAPWPIYLICSGVYENFYKLGEVKNLTFFKRAAEIRTEPFSMPQVAIKYQDMLNLSEEEAISYAKSTKGFAYAYQVFGSAYFMYKDKGIDYILSHAKSELFGQCYEKIWAELPEGERDILRILSGGPKKRKEILEKLGNAGSYQVNSNTLKNMGLLNSEKYGEVAITLPFFGEYIEKFC